MRRFGNHGAEECARLIKTKFGVKRTPEAVRRHAHRIGVPLVVYDICKGCGKKVKRLDREGHCPTCHTKQLRTEYTAKTRALMAELDANEFNGVDEARREYDKERQRVSRVRRKYRVSK